jgi:sucrose-6-phosphate hydrolase SacC (GH32 family)
VGTNVAGGGPAASSMTAPANWAVVYIERENSSLADAYGKHLLAGLVRLLPEERVRLQVFVDKSIVEVGMHPSQHRCIAASTTTNNLIARPPLVLAPRFDRSTSLALFTARSSNSHHSPRSSLHLQVFANGGRTVVTGRVYPTQPATAVGAYVLSSTTAGVAAATVGACEMGAAF